MKRLFGWIAGRSGDSAPPSAPEAVRPADLVADPYPIYQRLRESRPVVPLATGGYLLTRYTDVTAALTDPRLGNAPSRFSALNARNAEKHVASAMATRLPPFMDMPDHRAARQALTRGFFKALEPFKTEIDALAWRHAGCAGGRVNLIDEIASPFACEAMLRFVGLDLTASELKRLSVSFFHLFAPIGDAAAFSELNRQLSEGREMIRRSLVARGSRPGDDLISHLLRGGGEADKLTDEQVIDFAFLIAADGIENIEAAVALVLRRCLGEPDLARRANLAETIEPFVREALRLETPGQIIPRVAREPFVLHGVEIAQGMPVFLALGSANRDPSAFSNPDRVNEPGEDAAVTFGLGRHRCIGEGLAVLMISALVKALLARGVVQARSDKHYDYRDRFAHRWPVRAMITMPPA